LYANATLYCVYGDIEAGSSLLTLRSDRTNTGRRFPIAPPYLAVDRDGYLHVAGLDVKDRSHVLYFRSKRPHDIEDFGAGVPIHIKNYSSLATDYTDGSLYYFGAGIHARGIAFRRRSPDGQWSERVVLGTGRIIYPGAVIHDGIIHLIFCGWTDSAALYENVYYMRSHDQGGSWVRSDGHEIRTPFEWDPLDPATDQALDRVSQTFREGQFQANTHNLQLLVDRADHVHVLYYFVQVHQPRLKRTPRNQVMHVWHDGTRWRHNVLCHDPDIAVWMANMIADSDGTLHCVCTYRQTGRRHFDLGYASSSDGGDHWSAIEPITSNADSLGSNYMYPHWAQPSEEGKAYFVCSLGTGKRPSPLFLGHMSTGRA